MISSRIPNMPFLDHNLLLPKITTILSSVVLIFQLFFIILPLNYAFCGYCSFPCELYTNRIFQCGFCCTWLLLLSMAFVRCGQIVHQFSLYSWITFIPLYKDLTAKLAWVGEMFGQTFLVFIGEKYCIPNSISLVSGHWNITAL